MNASERGVNPYDPGQIGDVNMAAEPRGGGPYPPEAKGIDGELLDAMLKGRWQEGNLDGYDRGRQDTRRLFKEVYNEAYAVALATGHEEADREAASQYLPLLQQIAASFIDVAGKTGSEEIRDICNMRIGEIKIVLDAQIGRHVEQARGRVDEAGGRPA